MQPDSPLRNARRRLFRPSVSLLLAAVVGLLVTTLSLRAEQNHPGPAAETGPAGGSAPSTASEQASVAAEPAAIVAARQRAELMHAIYAETLHVMHERYFHGSRAIVPARAMEDIFKAMRRQSGVEARWLSVNVRAMSIHHEPKTEFERAAAKDIAAGQPAVEAIADGYYRRAGAIEMTPGCVACHDGFGKPPSNVPKFAALVISIPVSGDPAELPDSPDSAPASD
jgi:hypothetical protein